jgi:type VI protein secretion system component Hcp
MKTIILILLLAPILSFSQKANTFIRLTDARSQQIKGESTTKGFERWIEATSLTTGGKNNTQVIFTMMVSGASADLKRAMTNGEFLMNGQVAFTAMNQVTGNPLTTYTITLEKISVLSCNEAVGCNGAMNTTVTLQATRIGWTYFSTGKTGTQVVSKKYGWDAESNREWNNF